MKLLSSFCFGVFLLSFLHTTILVGAIVRTPFIGGAYSRSIEKSDNPLESFPRYIYAIVGVKLWETGVSGKVLNEIYTPGLRELRRAGIEGEEIAQIVRFLFNIRSLNILVLGSLAGAVIFIALGYAIKQNKKKQNK